jgi:hypothetical protein
MAKAELVGLIKVRRCCTFTWHEWREADPLRGDRFIEVGPEHCPACIAEVASLYPFAGLIERPAVAKTQEFDPPGAANEGSGPSPRPKLRDLP